MQQDGKRQKLKKIYQDLHGQVGLDEDKQGEAEVDLELFEVLCKLIMQASSPAELHT